MVLNGLMQQRIGYYNTNDATMLLAKINHKYKDRFDKDLLFERLKDKSSFNLNYIFSRDFKPDDFTKLSDEFTDKFKECLKDESVNMDNLLVDMLLLINVGEKVNYRYENQEANSSRNPFADFMAKF